MTWTPLFYHLSKVKPTRRLYETAADLIEKNGLIIDAYSSKPWPETDETCCFCLMGALLFSALGHTRHAFEVENIVAAPLGGVYTAVKFNETHIQPEVVAKLRATALTLEDA